MDRSKGYYCERTKRRRIAAEMSKVVAEMHAIEYEGSISSDPFEVDGSDNTINDVPSSMLAHITQHLESEYDFSVVDSLLHNRISGVVVLNPAIARPEREQDSELTELSVISEHVADINTEINFGSSDTADDISDSCEFVDIDDWIARHVLDDSESEYDQSESDFKEPQAIRDSIAEWADDYGVSHNCLSDLLNRLQVANLNLPKDARTLLHTQRKTETKNIAGGEYFYFGLHYWLPIILDQFPPQHDIEELNIHVNIDGIPLFNSSNTSLWPILCSIKESEASPFPAAVFCSATKPNPLDDYLGDFIAEMKALEQSGFLHILSNRLYRINLDAVICDAPARAFIKRCKLHNAYHCCERCMQRGEWCGKVYLPNLSAPLRTDENFKSREDEDHHTGVSPFSDLAVGMVTQFPLDYMHLVCLGVVRRMLDQWMHGPRSSKMSQNSLDAITAKLAEIRPNIPRDFARKPRSLSEFKHWKATELRLFLIYTGPVVLKGFLSPDMYSNFIDLSVAIRLLLSPSLCEKYLDFAAHLLKHFVDSFGTLYGRNQLVYNVHSLIHLPEDAKRYGVLDAVSSFKYESYLGRLKKLVRRPQFPCKQIVRRVFEHHDCRSESKKNDATSNSNCERHSLFRQTHMEGPLPISFRHCMQFKQYHQTNYLIATTTGDNCFVVAGKIGLIKNILREGNDDSCNGYVVFEEFERLESFFTDPLDSSILSIYCVQKLSGIRTVCPVAGVETKCVLLPYKNVFVAMPQMHFY